MRRTTLSTLAIASALTLAVANPASAARTNTTHHADGPAYFVFTDITHEEGVVKLDKPEDIKHARDLISGETTDRPHLIGRIVKRSTPYNPRWSFHYDPNTVQFFDNAFEVCDATIPFVEDHLDEAGGAFLPGLVWCPWTSRIVREIHP